MWLEEVVELPKSLAELTKLYSGLVDVAAAAVPMSLFLSMGVVSTGGGGAQVVVFGHGVVSEGDGGTYEDVSHGVDSAVHVGDVSHGVVTTDVE